MERYAIWNNKGGVGKTFLSFMLASEYADQYPDKQVIVVDMCPQANLSEIFLGGNGAGGNKMDEYVAKQQTIGAYFDRRIASPHQLTGAETSFFVNIHRVNEKMPPNVWLVVGSPRLELQAQVINQIGSQTLPPDSWKAVHRWLLDLIVAKEKELGATVTFVDCNPSFSAYTELAILAATQLVVPCSSDGSSARAIDNVSSLVYGQNLSEGYEEASFFKKTEKFGMALPKIRMMLLNRSTQYDKRASKAFSAMYEEIKKRTDSFRQKSREHFHTGFRYFDVPDAHSPAIVCAHHGLPIRALRQGTYDVHGKSTQVNRVSIDKYKNAIIEVVHGLHQ